MVSNGKPTANSHEEVRRTRYRYLGVLDIGVLLGSLIGFLVFLVLLNRFVFPEGSRLADLVSTSDSLVAANNDDSRIDLAGGAIDSFKRFVAQLADVRREVKIRSADSIVWRDAAAGISVEDRDAVQTFADSRARVDFTTDNELRIDQNSLVIFRNGTPDPFLGRRDPAVVVLEGSLAGKVNADYGSFAVEIPAGLAVMQAGQGAAESVDFQLSINPDNSSTVAIYSGVANVTVGSEQYVVVANSALTISEDLETMRVESLPALPAVLSPQTNTVAQFRNLPPRVVFEWDEVPGAQSYRFELARDPSFEAVVVDEHISDPSFIHGNLPEGDYFWRVSARSAWVHGRTTDPRRLAVERDAEPPVLELDPLKETTVGAYRLRGRTSPGAAVYVRGERVVTSADGAFEYAFDAPAGAQPIVVEAVDAVGNAAYRSFVVNFRSSLLQE